MPRRGTARPRAPPTQSEEDGIATSSMHRAAVWLCGWVGGWLVRHHPCARDDTAAQRAGGVDDSVCAPMNEGEAKTGAPRASPGARKLRNGTSSMHRAAVWLRACHVAVCGAGRRTARGGSTRRGRKKCGFFFLVLPSVTVAPGKPTTGAPRPGLLNCVARQQEHPANVHSNAWPPQLHN